MVRASLEPSADDPRLDVQITGSLCPPDSRPLPPAVNAFLDSVAQPVYISLGNTNASLAVTRTAIQGARELGLRTIVRSEWNRPLPFGAQDDCLVVRNVNEGALMRRAAVIVHDGNTRLTNAAALAGTPQVVHVSEEGSSHCADRVQALDIGVAVSRISADELATALVTVSDPAVRASAIAVAASMINDGAVKVAERLIAEYAPSGA